MGKTHNEIFDSLVTALVILASITHLMDWDDRLYQMYYPSLHIENPLSLNKYLLKEQTAIAGVKNLSGIVYNSDNNTLFMILNNPETLLECDVHGKILRRFDLKGFHDTEGLCYDGAGKLTGIEDHHQVVVTLPGPDKNGVIDRDDALNIIELTIFSDKNIGYEGVSYSHKHKSFFIAREKQPAAVFQLSNSGKINRLSACSVFRAISFLLMISRYFLQPQRESPYPG